MKDDPAGAQRADRQSLCGRRQTHRHLAEGCHDPCRCLRPAGQAGERDRAARPRNGRRLRRSERRHFRLLCLLGLQHPTDHLSLRYSHAQDHSVSRTGDSRLPLCRLRVERGLLQEQGRHTHSDVRHVQKRAEAGAGNPTLLYGSSDDETQFRYLLRYSPLHNVREGGKYPAILVTTSDHDDRVVPAHSFKDTAALQARASHDRPVLIRIETNSGHGSSRLTKALEETADVCAFLFSNLGVSPHY